MNKNYFPKLDCTKLIVLSLFVLTVSCNKNSTPTTTPSKVDKVAEQQKQLDDQKAANEKEKLELEKKQKENLAKEDQNSADQNQIEQQKADLEKLKEKVEGSAAINSTNLKTIVEKSKDPMYRMAAQLALGQSVPVLFYVTGSSVDQLHGVENELAAINVGPKFYSKIDVSDSEKVSGEFVVTLNSAEKFKGFLNYVHNNGAHNISQVQTTAIPLSHVFVRSLLELSYRQTLPYERTFQKRFWIGDSPVISVDAARPVNLEDVSSFVPYLKNCSTVSVDCFKTLVAENYFKSPSWINSSAQNPLNFLEQELGETSWLLGEKISGSLRYHPRNSAVPVVEEITLINTVWAVSDLGYQSGLVNFFGSQAATYVGQIGNFGTYMTPLKYETHMPGISGNKSIDNPVTITQLHNYICTVLTCVQR